jgi:hypothetical protein
VVLEEMLVWCAINERQLFGSAAETSPTRQRRTDPAHSQTGLRHVSPAKPAKTDGGARMSGTDYDTLRSAQCVVRNGWRLSPWWRGQASGEGRRGNERKAW